MKPNVVFSSRSGNTRMVAEAIAAAVGCTAKEIGSDPAPAELVLDEPPLIFIGSGVYGGNPHKHLLNAIERLAPAPKQRFALFLTWWGRGHSDEEARERIRSALRSRGHTLVDDCFTCYGQTMKLFKRGHPNEADLRDAARWAQRLTDRFC